jgi:predicted transcriptional regulator
MCNQHSLRGHPHDWFDALVRKGYVKEKSGKYKTTKKFTDLIADAADEVDKHVTPIKSERPAPDLL